MLLLCDNDADVYRFIWFWQGESQMQRGGCWEVVKAQKAPPLKMDFMLWVGLREVPLVLLEPTLSMQRRRYVSNLFVINFVSLHNLHHFGTISP